MAVALPRGAVTFVFTDIEGSTRLLRRLGDGYVEALERHRRVLREAWAPNGGVEVNTEGDACFVAFDSVCGALVACLAAQRGLADSDWSEGGVPRVRMGVHTGIAFPHDGDYIALAVHQAARVVNAAHGGQILASEQTIDALHRSGSADQVAVSNLGRYRLRDFDAPVVLYQVGVEHSDFPSVRAVPADQHNIVTVRNVFVGRHDDLVGLSERLRPGRLVTLVGHGGVGKTRLAMEVGLRVATAWSDGVWMVDLSGVTGDGHLDAAVAETLGLPAASESDRHAKLIDHLCGTSSLLILDNCEQINAECARLTRDVLDRCPSISVLATSREPLGLVDEDVYRLEPLAVIDDAVDLFVDRIGTAHHRDVDRVTVAHICERLDGLPLAIELAASRCSVMSPAEILTALDERFRLLASKNPAAPPRQRTMKGLLDWSFDLLSIDERVAFERLSVFPGSFGLAAAEAAVARDDLDVYDVPELVWSLVDKSLLVVEPAANATRYRMYETVRYYAFDRLGDTGGVTSTAATLGAWYIERFPLADRGDRAWISALAIDVDTITAVIDLADASDPSLPLLARIRAERRAVSGEPKLGCDEIDQVLERLSTPTPASARLMLFAAGLLGEAGEVERAWRLCEQGESLLDGVGETDRFGSVRAVSPRLMLLLRSGSRDAALEAEALAEAAVSSATSDAERANMLLQLAIARSALEHDGVVDVYAEVAELARRSRDHVLLALTLNNLVEEDLRLGQLEQAARRQRESLTFAAELGMDHLTTFGLIAAARIAEAHGADERATRLHALAESRLAETGLHLFSEDQALSDAMLARTAARLGEQAFAKARQSAIGMTDEWALNEADAILAAAAAVST